MIYIVAISFIFSVLSIAFAFRAMYLFGLLMPSIKMINDHMEKSIEKFKKD